MSHHSSYSDFQVAGPIEAAQILAEKTPKGLSGTAKLLYTVLCGTALTVAEHRQYSPSVTEVTFFAPAESVALAVGIHPATLYRNLPALAGVGLVEARGHYCTHNGQTRQDGTLWAVRLTPTWGSRARVGFDWMKRSHRSLGADIESGRTAYAQMRESKDNPEGGAKGLNVVLRFALSSQDLKTPLPFDSRTARRADLEALLDVQATPKEKRNQMVHLAAEALATALADQGSVNWYQKLLWAVLRRYDATGEDYSYQVYLMAQRARTDALEGFARRPGALFHSRLKQAAWYDEVRRGPPVRVGCRPLKA